MVCVASLRNFVVRATNLVAFSWRAKGHFRGWGRDLNVKPRLNFGWNCRHFRASMRMMLDSGASAEPPVPVTLLPENVQSDNYGYSSGRGKSEDGRLSFGYSSFRGRRETMEDCYDVKISSMNGQTVCLFGIFDGHGGERAAKYLKEHLLGNLMKHPLFMTDIKLAISEAYKKTDTDFLDERVSFRDDGSTAVTAILVGNHIFVANVGDSRCVMSKLGKAIALSDDQKPNRRDERERIENSGGFVIWAGTWRVGGVLAMSRAFGNRLLKPFVAPEPEIQEEEITAEVDMMILASDGLWDVVSNEDAIAIAMTEEEPEVAAQKLMGTAFSRGSADNITCIVVKLHHDKDITPEKP